jgi:hypothetical protein
MSNPISSDRHSSDRSQFYSDPEACDPSRQSCVSSASVSADSARGLITLDPVYVTGDPGARQLVEDFCAAEKSAALDACAKACGTAVAAGATAAVPLALAATTVITFYEGKECGKELARVYDCETR